MSTLDDRRPLVPPPLRLPPALREYLRDEAAGGVVLMVTAVALVWANSPGGPPTPPCGRPRWPSSSAASASGPTCATGSTTAS